MFYRECTVYYLVCAGYEGKEIFGPVEAGGAGGKFVFDGFPIGRLRFGQEEEVSPFVAGFFGWVEHTIYLAEGKLIFEKITKKNPPLPKQRRGRYGELLAGNIYKRFISY